MSALNIQIQNLPPKSGVRVATGDVVLFLLTTEGPKLLNKIHEANGAFTQYGKHLTAVTKWF